MAAQDHVSIKLSAVNHTLWLNTVTHRPVHQMCKALRDLSKSFCVPITGLVGRDVGDS